MAQIATELGISESCLRGGAAQDDVDAGRVEGVSSQERSEPAQLRREERRLEVENEIPNRAATTLLGRTSSQNDLSGGP